MLPYTKSAFENALMGEETYQIYPSELWYEERTDFSRAAIGTNRIAYANHQGFELIQGSSIFEGELLGGCLESLNEMIAPVRYADEMEICSRYGIFPDVDQWKEKILFLETSEEKLDPVQFYEALQNFKERGIMDVINGIIVGKPQDETFYEEYRAALPEVIDNPSLPILYNVNFGHALPRAILPYGAMAKVDAKKQMIIITK